jgi:D-glycero-D-manno-heptose 1,7-bisphosphate phosphatase
VRPAVFLDRDGTLIEERGYLSDLGQISLFPFSAPALRHLAAAGYALVLVTNQAGVARGYFDEAFVRTAHDALDRLLRAQGIAMDGYYYCPHHPAGVIDGYRRECRCRKPAPGMIQDAARDLGLDVARSWVIGDKWLDVELAARAGARGVLVRTGYGARSEPDPPPGIEPAAVLDDLGEAARWILAQDAVPR